MGWRGGGEALAEPVKEMKKKQKTLKCPFGLDLLSVCHLLECGPRLANVMSLDHIAADPVTLGGDTILQKVDYFQMLQPLVGNSVILHQQRLSYWWLLRQR